MMLKSLGKYREYAPITLRLMLGATLLFSHGLPKLMAPNRWEREGQAMAMFGITFAPVFWGSWLGLWRRWRGSVSGWGSPSGRWRLSCCG